MTKITKSSLRKLEKRRIRPSNYFLVPFIKRKNPVFYKKWQHELKQRQRVVKELEKAKEPPAEKMNELKEQIEWIKEVLA